MKWAGVVLGILFTGACRSGEAPEQQARAHLAEAPRRDAEPPVRRDPCEGLVVTGEPIASARANPRFVSLPVLEVRPHGSLKDTPPRELLDDFCRLRRGFVTENPDELLKWLLPRLQHGLSRDEVLEWLGPHHAPGRSFDQNNIVDVYWLRNDRKLSLASTDRGTFEGRMNLVSASRTAPFDKRLKEF